MTEIQERPTQSISHETWAQAFVRKSIAEPGFAQDEEAVAAWFSDAMGAAYTQGLLDGHEI